MHAFNLGGGKGDRESFLNTYGRSGTVFSIVSLLAQASATPEWHLFKKTSQDGRVRYTTGDRGSDQRIQVVQHAALQLLHCPNDFHTRFEFFEGSNQHLELTGETFWVVSREQFGFPTALWYVRPDRMEPVPSPDDYLVGWIYTGPNGEQVPLKCDEVIQEKVPDPKDPFRGAGPVASILPNIQQQRYATEYQRNLFIAGADPGGIIQVPNKLSETEFDELVNRWRESHQGVARAGRVGVLEAGATWATNAHNNKDMEYVNLRLNNRDEIREAWRMHKAMLGTVDDVNRANAETAEEIFVSWHTIPRLNRRRDTLNNKLLPMFGPTATDKEFDYLDPSPANRTDDNAELTTKAGAAQALVAAGYDPEAVAEVVGLPPMAFVGAPAAGPEPAREPNARERITVWGSAAGPLLNKRDTAAKVIEQLSKDYPVDAMAWVHHVTWMGPLDIRLDHIDMTGFDKLFGRSQSDVDKFQKRIRKGKAKPVILVKTPDTPLLKIIDGHGRTAAFAQMGQPVRAYVGVAPTEHGDWETMHDHQDIAGAEVGTQALAALLSAPYLASPIERAILNGARRGE
jgi:HK97 family phage portal protein